MKRETSGTRFIEVAWRMISLGAIACAPVAMRGADAWLKATTPRFTLLSLATERDTLSWAVEIDAYCLEVGATFPTDGGTRPPLTILLLPNDKALAPFKPVVDGRPHSSPALFYRSRTGATLIMSAQDPSNAQRRLIFHEALHWMMGGMANQNPAWLEEGLAEMFSSFSLNGAERMMGMPIAAHLALLKRESPMPTAKLIGLGRDSWMYDESIRTSMLYAQSWAFAHMLFLNRDGRGRAAVPRYLNLMEKAVPPAEAFRDAFGMTCEEMDQQLAAYLAARRFGVSKVTLDRGALEQNIVRAPAAGWEVDLARGRLLLAQQKYEVAETPLRAAHEQNPKHPLPLAALGECAFVRTNYRAAADWLDQAIAAGADTDILYLWRGQARLQSHRAPDGSVRKIDPMEARQIADDFVHAVRRNPHERHGYQALAGIVTSAEPRIPDDRAILVQGVSRWSQDAMLLLNLGVLDFQAGRLVEARESWRRILEMKPSAPARMRAQAEANLVLAAAAERANEVNRLLEQRDYGALRGRLDQLLQGDLPAAERTKFKNYRHQAALREKIDRAAECQQSGNLAEAERLLREVLADPAVDLETKTAARTALHGVERAGKSLNN